MDERYSNYKDFFKGLLRCVETIVIQQQEIESLKNWNACEAKDHERLIESDKRRIELGDKAGKALEILEDMADVADSRGMAYL